MCSREATLFVVDPDHRTREALVWLLEARFRVEAFESTAAFLAAYRARAWGCLLFDLGFPPERGVREYNELIATRVSLPVIVLTTDERVSGGFAASPFACVSNPSPRGLLFGRIHKALAQAEAIEACPAAER